MGLLQAWFKLGPTTKTNMALRSIATFGWRDLEKKWETMTLEACEAEVLDAQEKIRLKRRYSDADKVIAAMGAKVLKRKKELMIDYPSFVKMVDSREYIDREDFMNGDNIQIKEWNVDDGSISTYSVAQWLQSSRYRLRTLIIHGDSDVGKTQIALTIAAGIALDIKPSNVPRAYFVLVQTVEGLSAAANGGWLLPNIPILLDEVKPSAPRGTRPSMSAEELKKLTTVTTGVTLDARYRDLRICENQPRIVTANAMDPNEWHEIFPSDLFNTSEASRFVMDADAKAVGKRTAWAHVQHDLIPRHLRDAYNA